MTRVLIVEDRDSLREMLIDFLEDKYYVFSAVSAEEGEKLLLHYPDIVICDLKLPGKSGIEFIEVVKDRCPESEVIIMTAFGDIPTAVEAIKKGAFDFIPKPLDLNYLSMLLEKAKNSISLKRRVDADADVELIGECPVFKKAVSDAVKVAAGNMPVLITGESGTGKELFARFIHSVSPRKEKMFVPVNASSLPETLFESELFGYVKGAFTGAEQTKKGLIETAEGGTLFFDEIGDMPLSLQPKILRLIETGEYQRVGDGITYKADVRFVFATNRDLKNLVEQGKFRKDLFFRIAGFEIKIPSLRERREDIPLLAEYFAEKLGIILKGKPFRLSGNAIEYLKNQDWNGNIRELKNTIERWIILDKCEFENSLNIVSDKIEMDFSSQRSYREYMEYFEKKLLMFYLAKHKGNKTAVAKELNMNYKTLLSKLEKFGL